MGPILVAFFFYVMGMMLHLQMFCKMRTLKENSL